MIAAWLVGLSSVTVPIPDIPSPVGFSAVTVAVVGLVGAYIRFRTRQVSDWGDLIERQEKTIVRLEAELDNARKDLTNERAEARRLYTISEKNRRLLVTNGIEVPE